MIEQGLTTDQIICEGERLVESGNFEEAKKVFNVVCDNEVHPRALNDLGVVHFLNEEYEASLKYFYKALVADKRNDDVIENFCNALEASPKISRVTYYAGKVRELLCDEPKKLDRIEKALKTDEARASKTKATQPAQSVATLQEIGVKHGTDKSFDDGGHTYYGLSYLDIYAKYFESIRYQPINFLEIGVLDGASLRTFQEYFPNGNIYGLDIDPRCKAFEGDRIKVMIGSQADTSVLEQVRAEIGSFDIIIDDGSHVVDHMITSFEHLFDAVTPGGYYIMEDVGCTYTDPNMGWPGMRYNKEDALTNDREAFGRFILDRIAAVDRRRGNLFALHCWNYIMIMNKVPETSKPPLLSNFTVC